MTLFTGLTVSRKPLFYNKNERKSALKASRYGMNGQENDNEVSGQGNVTTAEYWEYDSRIGRRWNVDPMAYSWQSGYSAFNDNPIIFVDPLGLFGDRAEAKAYKKEHGLKGRVRKSDDGSYSIDNKKNHTSTWKDSEFGIQTGVLVEARRSDNPTVSPWKLGAEWASGKGARSRDFIDGDAITTMYKQHEHVEETRQKVKEQLQSLSGEYQLPIEGSNPYSLGGVEGVGKYVKDYSTLATGGMTGNLVYTYLGSHSLTYTVSDIDVKNRVAIVTFFVSNTSTIQSATRPPVIGYQQWYKNTIGKAVDSQFSSGPFSETEQSIEWTEKIKY